MIKSKGDNFYPFKYTCLKKGCHHAKSPLLGNDWDFGDGRCTDACGDTITECETRNNILCIQSIRDKKHKKQTVVNEIDDDLYLLT